LWRTTKSLKCPRRPHFGTPLDEPGAPKNATDLTPFPALRGDTPVALLAVGGSHHHYLGAERHLRDVLSFFGAALVLPSARGDVGTARRGAEPLGPPPLAACF
jgi:NAD(P)H-dependent FMN reductase